MRGASCTTLRNRTPRRRALAEPRPRFGEASLLPLVLWPARPHVLRVTLLAASLFVCMARHSPLPHFLWRALGCSPSGCPRCGEVLLHPPPCRRRAERDSAPYTFSGPYVLTHVLAHVFVLPIFDFFLLWPPIPAHLSFSCCLLCPPFGALFPFFPSLRTFFSVVPGNAVFDFLFYPFPSASSPFPTFCSFFCSSLS